MTLQRSPTLGLAEAVDAARARGQPAWSLSTPTFPELGGELAADTLHTRLSPASGLPELRQRCRQVLFGKWDLPDHRVLITAGAKAAVLAALRTACRPGDRVLIIAPSWPSYADLARLLYLDPVRFDTRFEDGFAIDPAALAEAADRCSARVIVLCNPGNPTGRIVRGPELAAVSGVARERDALLLLDESFAGVVFDPELWRQSRCAGHERLVVVGSLSKSHQLQGLRIGACLAAGGVREAMVAAHQAALSAAPSLSQSVALHRLAAAAPPDLAESRALALALVDRQGWRCTPSEGSFYLFPRVPALAAFAAEARQRGLYLLPGEVFGDAFRDHFRLCFGKSADEFRQLAATLGRPGQPAVA